MELTRGIPQATISALSGVFHPVVLVWIDWPDAPVRAHSSVGQLLHDGHVWHGVGGFGSIALPVESVGASQSIADLALVGVGDDLDRYLEAPARGRLCSISVGALLERDGNVLAAPPFELFRGYVDATAESYAKAALAVERTVRISVVNGPSQRETGSFYHTAEDQAVAHPGDTAGRHAINAESEILKLRWPE